MRAASRRFFRRIFATRRGEGGRRTRSVDSIERTGEVVVVGLLAVLALLAWRIPLQTVRFMLVVCAFAVWLVALVGFLGVLGFEHDDVGPSSLSCPIPGDDSAGYPAHWSWIPPGEVCERPDGNVGPTYMRIPFADALVVIPVVALVAWPRRRVNRRHTDPLVGQHSS